MSMVMNFVMVGCGYPILLIMYFFMKLEVGDKKKTVLGIAIPEMFRRDPQVLEICRQFRRSLKRGFAVMLIFPAVFLWMPWFTWYITGYLVWIYLMIFVLLFPAARYGERLKELKRQMKWGGGRNGETDVDFVIALQPVRVVKKWILAVMCVVSVLPVLWEVTYQKEPDLKWSYTMILLLMAAVVWSFCGILLWMDRQKSELISKDSDVNKNFNRSKKRLRASAWTWMTALSVVLVWLTALALHDYLGGMTVYTVEITVYTIVVCVLAFRCEWKILCLRKKMMTTLESYDSDEDNWYFGALLYYNPNDRHTLIEDRIGTGYSVNLGSVAGKVIMGLTALLMIGCLVGVPLAVGRDEFTPVGLKAEDGILKSVHTGVEYEIDETEIASVTLLEQLPDVSRKNGTGLKNLAKGRYRIDGYGTGYLCLNPQNGEFLMVETADGTIYLLSDATDAGTLAVYRKLSANSSAG